MNLDTQSRSTEILALRHGNRPAEPQKINCGIVQVILVKHILPLLLTNGRRGGLGH
jgi:hypothetical protein